MKLSRRDFMKANAVAAAAAVAGVSAPTLAANLITSTDKTAITWDKAPCRFCGTGCSVLVGSQAGRVVATQAPGGRRPATVSTRRAIWTGWGRSFSRR